MRTDLFVLVVYKTKNIEAWKYFKPKILVRNRMELLGIERGKKVGRTSLLLYKQSCPGQCPWTCKSFPGIFAYHLYWHAAWRGGTCFHFLMRFSSVVYDLSFLTAFSRALFMLMVSSLFCLFVYLFCFSLFKSVQWRRISASWEKACSPWWQSRDPLGMTEVVVVDERGCLFRCWVGDLSLTLPFPT